MNGMKSDVISVGAEILSVGSEILLGRIVDTNAVYLSQELMALGVPVSRHTSVPDEEPALLDALRTAAERTNLLILTGGIGPTADDLTRDAVAEFCGVALREDAAAAKHVRELFARRGRPMPESNLVQALIPEGADVIPNPRGTACGFAVRSGSTEMIVLPGVPHEMKLMFERWVKPHLRRRFPDQPKLVIREIRTIGMPESALGQEIADLMEPGRNPAVGTQATGGIIIVRAMARARDETEAERLLDEAEAVVRARLGDAVFGVGPQGLPEAVADILERKGLTLAVAESCTGGLVCDMLTDVPGISRFLLEGVVAYSNEAKTARLGVPPELFKTVGAVSREVAVAMADGVRERAGADVGVGITGIAGPGGATPAKPVGLVHVAVSVHGRTEGAELRLFGNRREVKDRAAKYALNLLRMRLLGEA